MSISGQATKTDCFWGIAKCHMIMSMYIINLGWSWKYKVQVLNVQQENEELLESIIRFNDIFPQGASTQPTLWLRKQQGNDPKKLTIYKYVGKKIKND